MKLESKKDAKKNVGHNEKKLKRLYTKRLFPYDILGDANKDDKEEKDNKDSNLE